jgi:pyruvate-formate lyase
MVHPSQVFEYAASPNPNIRILTNEKLNEFRKATKEFIKSVATSNELGNQAAIMQKLMACKLRAADFVDNYTIQFTSKNQL